MARILPFIRHQFFDSDGNPLVGGKIYTYVAGTTTPLATYTDKDEGTENANPIILDANGEASIWVGDAFYKFVIADANDVVLRTIDKVTSASDVTAEATAAQVAAEAAQAAAEAARDAALTAETNAETAETNAETAETNAESAQAAAEAARDAALTAETNAELAETNAEAAQVAAEAAAVAADLSAAAAAASASAAATAASSSLWNDVSFKTFADSPISILNADSGTMFVIDCTGGNVVVNLPAISALTLTPAWAVGFKKSDTSTNTITVNRNGADTIDGGTSIAITRAEAGATLIPDIDPSPDEWTSISFGEVPISGAIVGTTDTQALTNKDIDGGTASNTNRLTLPKNTKTNLDGLTRKEGTIVYATDQAKAYVDNGSALVAVGSGSGGGGINYLSANSDAETDTTGWATYADAAGVAPVDGTGGSPNVTFTRTTSSPLRGTASFLFTKDAANRQGQGASYNFNLDSADGGKMMQITFDYAIASGTYATGDLAVYVIHDPNGTPKIIHPSGYQIENVGVNSVARMTFQTEVSAQLDYTLCFHVASTSASAYTVKLDNVQLGPQVVPMGAPVTDWVSYTPTISGLGTGGVSAAFGKWRRVGDSMEIQYNWTKDGSGGSGAVSVATSLPSGYTVDTSKIPNGANFVNGEAYSSLTTDLVQVIESSTGSGYFIKRATATTFNGADATAGSNYRGYFKVPIVGWSSSTVVSSSADTRVVAMTARNYSNGTLASGASHTVILNTVATDTHGAYNSATGEYTVKVPGNYSINGEIGMSATAAAATRQLFLYIRVNGTGISNTYSYANTTSTITHRAQARVNWYCNAGDVITLVAENDLGGTGTPQTGTGNSNFSINLIQGPSQIAASEVIAARYSTAVAQSIPGTGAATIVDFGTKDFDTHSGVTTGVAWKYTAQAPGIYEVSSMVTLAGSTGWADTEGFEVILYKNGVANHRLGYRDSFGSASSVLANAGGCGMISLVAGDYIDVRVANTSGGAINTFNSASYNWVTVKRLGGV